MRKPGSYLRIGVAALLWAGVAAAQDVERIVRENEQSVLVIEGVKQSSGAPIQGSGFCVDIRGYVVATAHQARGVGQFRGRLKDGTSFSLEPIEVDDARELALFKSERPLPRAVRIGDANTLVSGSPLVSISSPNRLDFTTVTGIVSNTNRVYQGLPIIQTDLQASPGSSGGPVFDRDGELVGVTILHLEAETWVNFINPVNNMYAMLRRHGLQAPPPTPLPGSDAVELVPAANITDIERHAIEAYNSGVAAADPKVKAEAYRRAVTLLTGFYESWFNLAVASNHAQDYAAAEEAYRRAGELRPQAVEVKRNLGRLLLRRQRIEEALIPFQEALALAPLSAQSHNDLGETYRRLKRNKDAIGPFLEAIRLKPGYAEAHYNLALALIADRQREEAKKHLTAYLTLNPNASDAESVRAMIDKL